MSNLGLYQEFAIAAKAAGGVAKKLEDIERAAVSKALPSIAGAGAAAGAAGATLILVAGKKFWDKRRADQVAAEDAKKRLISEFSNDAARSGESPTPPASA